MSENRTARCTRPTHRSARSSTTVAIASEFARRRFETHDAGMSIDEKIACGINVVFGAAVGFGFYAIGLGGLWWLITSRNPHWWNGWIAFLLCVGGGGVIGFLMYKNRLNEIDLHDRGGLSEGIYAGKA